MRKYLNFCLLIALLSVFTVASAQRNGNPSHTPRTAVTVSSGNQPFWLFIDDIQQNDNPATSIRVEAIPEGQHYLRVELDNPDHLTIGQYVTLQRNRNAYWIENQRNLFGLSPDRGTPNPEVVIFYKFVQQNQPHNPYGHSNSYDNRPQNEPPHNQPEQIPPAPVPTVFAMPDNNFQQALELIRKESFENGKLSIAKQVLDNNMLNISQIKQICAVFDFDKTRLEFVRDAYSKCTEKENYYLLNSVFEFNSSKTEFDKFLKSQK